MIPHLLNFINKNFTNSYSFVFALYFDVLMHKFYKKGVYIVENNLLPVKSSEFQFDEELCGVILEKSKRKKKRKKRKVKFLATLLILCISIVIVKNFERIGSYISAFFVSSPNNSVSSAPESTDSPESNNNQSSEKIESSQAPSSFNFIDTSPCNSIITNNFIGDADLTKLSYSFLSTADIYSRYGSDAPIVLIVNFSPNEAYSSDTGYTYTSTFYNDENNVQSIAKQICDNLNELGINAMHLECNLEEKTLYSNAKAYKASIESILSENPSISFIFDISRNLNINNDMSMYNEFVDLNGVKLPTINFSIGTKEKTITESQKKGIFISDALSNFINNKIPYLVSRQTIQSSEINQVFSVPTVRVEIGGYASTFEGASLTADYFSLFVSEFLNTL